MKLILSNFLENFQEWKEKISEKNNKYLDNIVSDIENTINSNDNSANKARELVRYFQDIIDVRNFIEIFDYNALEYKLIAKNFNDKSLSNYLYMDFRKDLEDLEEKNINALIDDNRDYLSIGIKNKLSKKLFEVFSKWKRASIISELVSLDNNGVWTDKDNMSENGRPATTNELLYNLINMTLNNSAEQDYLPNTDENSNDIAKIIEEYENTDLNERFIDDSYTDEDNNTFIMVGEYCVFHIPNVGWGYYKYDKDYKTAKEVAINLNLEDNVNVNLEFTHEILGKIDFTQFDEYSEIYSVVDEFNNNSIYSNTFYTNKVLHFSYLKQILTISTKIYADSIAIVNYLYDNQTDEINKLFENKYPWKYSFDDIANQILGSFNAIYSDLNENQNIIDIDSINNVNTEKVSGNIDIKYSFVSLNNDIKEFTELVNKNQFSDDSWKLIYNNENFKELYESLIYQFNFNEKSIRDYILIQLDTVYPDTI